MQIIMSLHQTVDRGHLANEIHKSINLLCICRDGKCCWPRLPFEVGRDDARNKHRMMDDGDRAALRSLINFRPPASTNRPVQLN